MGCGKAFKWNPGCDSCDDPECRFTVRGCGYLGLKHAHVKVWADSSKTVLIGEGDTNSSGRVDFPVTPGNRYLESTAERFDLKVIDPLVVPVGGTGFTVDMAIASGYRCAAACGIATAYPINETLYATNSIGSFELAYQSFYSSWRWLGKATWPGCGLGCANGGCDESSDTMTEISFGQWWTECGRATCMGAGCGWCLCPYPSDFIFPGPLMIEAFYGADKIVVPFIPGESAFLVMSKLARLKPGPWLNPCKCLLAGDIMTVTE